MCKKSQQPTVGGERSVIIQIMEKNNNGDNNNVINILCLWHDLPVSL